MEKVSAPFMRCVRTILPCASITETETGTLMRDASASTRVAMLFAKDSRSMVEVLLAAELAQVATQAIFDVARRVESAVEQRLNPALSCRPADRGHAGLPSR